MQLGIVTFKRLNRLITRIDRQRHRIDRCSCAITRSQNMERILDHIECYQQQHGQQRHQRPQDKPFHAT